MADDILAEDAVPALGRVMPLQHKRNVTPRPERESTVHDTVGVYKSTKCHIVVFWRLKWEMINLWNPKSYKT